MNPPSKTVQGICQLLRHNVRLRSAGLTLPGHSSFTDDTPVIREALRVYTESWIIPLIDKIETGDTDAMRHTLSCLNSREPIGTPPAVLEEVPEGECSPARWSLAMPTKSGLYMLRGSPGWSGPPYDVVRVHMGSMTAAMIHWDNQELPLEGMESKGHRWLGPLPESDP